MRTLRCDWCSRKEYSQRVSQFSTKPWHSMRGSCLPLSRRASQILHTTRTHTPKLAILECQRSIARVNVVQDALVADVLLGNKADARAHKGDPRGSFVGHRTLLRGRLTAKEVPRPSHFGGEREIATGGYLYPVDVVTRSPIKHLRSGYLCYLRFLVTKVRRGREIGSLI